MDKTEAFKPVPPSTPGRRVLDQIREVQVQQWRQGEWTPVEQLRTRRFADQTLTADDWLELILAEHELRADDWESNPPWPSMPFVSRCWPVDFPIYLGWLKN